MNTAAGGAAEPLGKIVVISDVHVGAGNLDDFTEELQEHLVRFLSELSALTEPVELVINGDFFDFATAEPWDDPQLESKTATGVPLCFTEAQSYLKLEKIIQGHGPVFDALACFLASGPRKQVTMLPGNHDADLFWPKVQKRIVRRLAQSLPLDSLTAIDRFRFILERQYVLQRSEIRYWIEHGHQHDPQNCFFVGKREYWSAAEPPIFNDVLGNRRLYECTGTLFLVRHINRWRVKYRSLSYLKPYSRVLAALVGYRWFTEPGRPTMVLRSLGAFLGWQVDLKKALSSDGDLRPAGHEFLQQLVNNLTTGEEEELVSYLREHGISVDNSLRSYTSTETRRNRIFAAIASEQTKSGYDPALGFLDRPPSARMSQILQGSSFA